VCVLEAMKMQNSLVAQKMHKVISIPFTLLYLHTQFTLQLVTCYIQFSSFNVLPFISMQVIFCLENAQGNLPYFYSPLSSHTIYFLAGHQFYTILFVQCSTFYFSSIFPYNLLFSWSPVSYNSLCSMFYLLFLLYLPTQFTFQLVPCFIQFSSFNVLSFISPLSSTFTLLFLLTQFTFQLVPCFIQFSSFNVLSFISPLSSHTI
jgi:hypothetical protein